MADEVKEKLGRKGIARTKVSMSFNSIPLKVHKVIVREGRKYLAAKFPGGNFTVKDAYMEFLKEKTHPRQPDSTPKI
jgi:hypothetical protein